MKDILQEIIENKQKELILQKEQLPFDELILRLSKKQPAERSFRKVLEESPTGIIAEFKRRSPSKGWIHEEADVATIVAGYEKAGAAACSVLTDSLYFGGSSVDLIEARKEVSLPLLRKEFIIDSYQIYEAALLGADAILLIAACLTVDECRTFARLARCLGMEVLLEVHHESELDRLNPCVDMLGVNNRHLGTFHTDVVISFRMAEAMQVYADRMDVPPLLVSESGLSDAQVVEELRRAGFRGFLMGETFMREEYPAEACTQFIESCMAITEDLPLRLAK